MTRHEQIGARIKAAREAAGWTQKDLAAALATDNALVCRWETGTTMPTVTSLRKLSKMLRVPMAELLG